MHSINFIHIHTHSHAHPPIHPRAGIQSTVRKSMEESLVQILSPKRRIDVLRDVMQASGSGRPYVITFCGVNGVGKSTNLAKIAFWLLENDHRVLIAACDTFRSGAVEQLRTHARHLGSLHPPPKEGAPANILLYDRGYGKDAAGVAMEAIHFGELRVDHVNSSVSLSKLFEPPWPAYAPDHYVICTCVFVSSHGMYTGW